MLRRLAVLLVAIAAGLATPAAGIAHGATHCNDLFPLHAGSCGTRVAALQWLIHTPRPKQNVFTQIHGTFKWAPNGSLGARTKHALVEYRWRLGYPQTGQCGSKSNQASSPTAGRYFFRLVEGKATRPACWVALAAKRVKAVNTGPTPFALEVKAYGVQLLERKIHEVPDGTNRGPCISVACGAIPALQSATGAYGEAWCVSTWQTILVKLGYGTFADGTAGVYAAVDYYAARSQLSAKPKVGALVAFIDYDSRGIRIPGTGHMGFVAAVQASSFTYMAGNDGNAFREHTIADGSRSYAFIYLRKLTF